jgi:hypothetical protein
MAADPASLQAVVEALNVHDENSPTSWASSISRAALMSNQSQEETGEDLVTSKRQIVVC